MEKDIFEEYEIKNQKEPKKNVLNEILGFSIVIISISSFTFGNYQLFINGLFINKILSVLSLLLLLLFGYGVVRAHVKNKIDNHRHNFVIFFVGVTCFIMNYVLVHGWIGILDLLG
jgi:hypothetical protein